MDRLEVEIILGMEKLVHFLKMALVYVFIRDSFSNSRHLLVDHFGSCELPHACSGSGTAVRRRRVSEEICPLRYAL
jgi:hypothetical protein